MSPADLADIRRRAVEDNERDARLGLMPRHCEDPGVLSRVAALVTAAGGGQDAGAAP
jgi:hypothetical protein